MAVTVRDLIKKCWQDEQGSEVVSFPMLAAIVAIAALLAWGTLREQPSGTLQAIGDAMEGASNQL